MKKNLFVLFFLFSVNQSMAQNHQQVSIPLAEDTINSCFIKLSSTKNDSTKKEINHIIIDFFSAVLTDQKSFEYSFSKIKFISILKSEDNQVKIYNWDIPYSDGTFEYFGFIQYQSAKKNNILLFPLADKSNTIESPENSSLNNENWYGALYYQIILKKDGKKKYYTLLGWDGNNDLSAKKIIEVLTFSSNGKPIFGASLFKIGNKNSKRLIFEFSKEAQMALRYEKNYDMIIMDHLSPSEPRFKGQFQFYGPDFSYDGLSFKKGVWLYMPDIDVRNPKEKANKRKLIYGY
jgi:hypothetical protein